MRAKHGDVETGEISVVLGWSSTPSGVHFSLGIRTRLSGPEGNELDLVSAL